jgi:hypothetical protein
MIRRACVAFAFVVAVCSAWSQNSRHFTFHYEFTVRAVDQGQPLQVWIPLAHSDKYQTVKVISQKGDLPLKQAREKRFGNIMLYAQTTKADRPAEAISSTGQISTDLRLAR